MTTVIIMGSVLLVLVVVSSLGRPSHAEAVRYPGERRRELARLVARTRCRGDWE